MNTANELLNTANKCEKAINIISSYRTPNEIRSGFKKAADVLEEINSPVYQNFGSILKNASAPDMLDDDQVIKIRDEMVAKFTKDARNYRELAKEIGGGSSSSGGGCYIATACYGDYNAPQVVAFKQYRDKFLLKKRIGQSIIKIYYKFSPYLANRLKNNLILNRIIRKALLDPIYKYYIIRKNRN